MDDTKFLVIAVSIITVLAAPFVGFHVYETWDKPEYPHSGFCPDSPKWIAPEEEERQQGE